MEKARRGLKSSEEMKMLFDLKHPCQANGGRGGMHSAKYRQNAITFHRKPLSINPNENNELWPFQVKECYPQNCPDFTVTLLPL